MKVMSNNIIIAAAAFIKNACCGRDVQSKICIGSTVNSSNGDDGIKGTYASAPITIKGAVSPTARDNAKIVPVKIPPIDEGRICNHIVCHFEAPNANEASRNDCGTALRDSRVATIIIGKMSNAKVN